MPAAHGPAERSLGCSPRPYPEVFQLARERLEEAAIKPELKKICVAECYFHDFYVRVEQKVHEKGFLCIVA